MIIIPQRPFVIRRLRSSSPASPPPPPPPPVALMIAAWLEDPQTLDVQFDQPVTVAGGGTTDVGFWVIGDDVAGLIVPVEMVQLDFDTIGFITGTEMTAGTVAYNNGNPGALSTANGFPDGDEHAY